LTHTNQPPQLKHRQQDVHCIQEQGYPPSMIQTTSYMNPHQQSIINNSIQNSQQVNNDNVFDTIGVAVRLADNVAQISWKTCQKQGTQGAYCQNLIQLTLWMFEINCWSQFDHQM
jgi:hypothetical protein